MRLLTGGRVGRWTWPWALAGSAVLAGLVVTLSGLAGGMEERLAAWLTGAEPSDSELLPGRLDTYAGFLLFAAALTLPTYLVSRTLHRHPPGHLLGLSPHFDWGLCFRAAGAFLVAFAAGLAVTALTEPETLAWETGLVQRLPWILLALPVILFQSFAEDYVFKGYLLRTFGAVLPYTWIVVPAIAVIFTAGHAINADVASDLRFNLVAFFAGEIVLMAAALKAGNLGAATGLHWMNNVWSMCLVASKPGQSSALSIASYTDPTIVAGGSHFADPIAWLEIIALYGLLWFLLTWPRSPFSIVRPFPIVREGAADSR